MLKLAHKRFILSNKIRWLCHVDILLQENINARIIYINLLDWPLVGEGQSEEHPYSGGFDHQWEGFTVVFGWLLMVSFGNKASFILIDGPIWIFFYLEDPTDGFPTGR